MSDYWGQDKLSQAEKRKEVIRDTFMHRAAADAELLNSGRFAKEQATTVVGATPSAPVPRQPETSPWAQRDENVEPPFDTDISAVEPILPASSALISGGQSRLPDAGTGGSALAPLVAPSQPSRSHFRRRF